MLIDDELKKYESEYYKAFYKIHKDINSKKWMGKVRIRRKDTNEIVRGGFRVVGENKDDVEEELLNKISDNLNTDLNLLGTPYEWNCQIRPLLVKCLKFRSFITKFGIVCEKAISKEISSEEFNNAYFSFWNEQIKWTIDIVKGVEKLSPKERIQMLVSPEHIFKDPSDPWSLDDLHARIGVFKFFLNPNETEIKAHQKQLSMLYDRNIELGWIEPNGRMAD